MRNEPWKCDPNRPKASGSGGSGGGGGGWRLRFHFAGPPGHCGSALPWAPGALAPRCRRAIREEKWLQFKAKQEAALRAAKEEKARQEEAEKQREKERQKKELEDAVQRAREIHTKAETAAAKIQAAWQGHRVRSVCVAAAAVSLTGCC